VSSPASEPDARKSKAPGSGRKAMLLRLDPQVHAALSRWADDDLRSTNAHVEWLLRRILVEAGRLPTGKPTARPGEQDELDEDDADVG